MADAQDCRYKELCRLVPVLELFTAGTGVQEGAGCHFPGEDTFPETVSRRVSRLIQNIIWDEDAVDVPSVACEAQAAPAPAGDIGSSVKETPVEVDMAGVSTTENEAATSPDRASCSPVNSNRVAEDNFSSFTYWTVETGRKVSSTSEPLYASNREKSVTLLEEAEAFVALLIWGSEPDVIKQTPRHLLLQAAQVASRAFFDPDYRNYLLTSYVK